MVARVFNRLLFVILIFPETWTQEREPNEYSQKTTDANPQSISNVEFKALIVYLNLEKDMDDIFTLLNAIRVKAIKNAKKDFCPVTLQHVERRKNSFISFEGSNFGTNIFGSVTQFFEDNGSLYELLSEETTKRRIVDESTLTTSPDFAHLPNNSQPVTEMCLRCICQAVSGCKQGFQCMGNVCGLFHITQPYWADAGKPTLPGKSPDSTDAYSSCTIDPFCAAQTVRGYMRLFPKDCNGDGRVDCYDYIRIHKLGGYGCKGPLDPKFENTFNQCIAAVAQAQQG